MLVVEGRIKKGLEDLASLVNQPVRSNVFLLDLDTCVICSVGVWDA